MTRRGVTYAQLVERLREIGVDENERNLRNKVSRRKNYRRVLATMPESDRSKLHSAIRYIACSVIVGLFIAVVWNVSSNTTKSRIEHEAAAKQYSESTEKKVRETCVVTDPIAFTKCAIEQIEASREDQRAERDLVAQSSMDRWAFYMLWVGIATAGIAAAGAWWVRETLVETRRAVKAANATVVATEQIGQAQTRAYVGINEIKVDHPVVGETLKAEIKIVNTGMSPAYDVKGWYNIRNNPDDVGQKDKSSSDEFAILGHGIVKSFRKQASSRGFAKQRFIDMFDRNRWFIYVYGEVTYTDVFGDKYRLGFSFEYRNLFGDWQARPSSDGGNYEIKEGKADKWNTLPHSPSPLEAGAGAFDT